MMTVLKLILTLARMPLGAEVRHIWDGSARTGINHVWLSQGGAVMTADEGEYVPRSKDMPINAKTTVNGSWYTPEGK
jgi:hypothetical protein